MISAALVAVVIAQTQPADADQRAVFPFQFQAASDDPKFMSLAQRPIRPAVAPDEDAVEPAPEAAPAADPVPAVVADAPQLPDWSVNEIPPDELQRIILRLDQATILSPEQVQEHADEQELSPSDILDLVALDLEQIPPARRPYVRWLTVKYVAPARRPDMEAALLFWTASLNRRRVNPPLTKIANGLIYRLFIDDYGWSPEAWEALARGESHWAVTTKNKNGDIVRGWVDPLVEYGIRKTTGSIRAVLRAEYFLAKTSIDVGSGGFYSLFLGLPNTEAALYAQYGIDEKYLADNALLQGGAVLQSIVAQNNRELELLPSAVGADLRFLWRSNDTDDDVGDKSVLRQFMGTINRAGREFIGTNRNGTHWYYLANAAGAQLGEVPTNIAQDKLDPHEARVLSPYKCVSCHSLRSGIRPFDDVISAMALHPEIGLGAFGGDYDSIDELRYALQDYYLSDLGRVIKLQQDSYARAILEINGLTPAENGTNYLEMVNLYLHGTVDMTTAAIELGVAPDEADPTNPNQLAIVAYLKATENPDMLALVAGQRISRRAFDASIGDLLQVIVYPWEEKVQELDQPELPVSPPVPYDEAVKPVVPAGSSDDDDPPRRASSRQRSGSSSD